MSSHLRSRSQPEAGSMHWAEAQAFQPAFRAQGTSAEVDILRSMNAALQWELQHCQYQLQVERANQAVVAAAYTVSAQPDITNIHGPVDQISENLQGIQSYQLGEQELRMESLSKEIYDLKAERTRVEGEHERQIEEERTAGRIEAQQLLQKEITALRSEVLSLKKKVTWQQSIVNELELQIVSLKEKLNTLHSGLSVALGETEDRKELDDLPVRKINKICQKAIKRIGNMPSSLREATTSRDAMLSAMMVDSLDEALEMIRSMQEASQQQLSTAELLEKSQESEVLLKSKIKDLEEEIKGALEELSSSKMTLAKSDTEIAAATKEVEALKELVEPVRAFRTRFLHTTSTRKPNVRAIEAGNILAHGGNVKLDLLLNSMGLIGQHDQDRMEEIYSLSLGNDESTTRLDDISKSKVSTEFVDMKATMYLNLARWNSRSAPDFHYWADKLEEIKRRLREDIETEEDFKQAFESSPEVEETMQELRKVVRKRSRKVLRDRAELS